MTETVITETVRNGVDTATMFATLDAIKAQPEIAKFRFRARNQWLGGSHNRSTIKDFYAACGEDTTRTEAFELDAGHEAAGALMKTSLGMAVLVSLVHVAAMVGAGGCLAWLVYRHLGLRFVSRSWFNLDAVWAISLVLVGAVALAFNFAS